MALTQSQKYLRRGPPTPGAYGYQVAPGEQIWRGSIVGLNASGYLQRAQTAGTVVLVGLAQQDYSNVGNASASSDYIVAERGYWQMPVAGAAVANIDGNVYATDDSTLTVSVPGAGEAASVVAGNPNFAVANSPMNGLGAAGANTGNGAVGSVTVASTAKLGTYLVLFSAPTVFSVIDPNGDRLKTTGATGAAFADGGLIFTVTAGGTAFVAGDSFTITAAANVSPLFFGTLNGFEKGAPVVRIKGS